MVERPPRNPDERPAGRINPDRIYHRLFEQDADGAAILEELCEEFFYRISFSPEDPYTTAYKEGQRSVLLELLDRISRGGQ